MVPRKWGSGIAEALQDAALALVPGVCRLEVLELNPPHPVLLGYSHPHQQDRVE